MIAYPSLDDDTPDPPLRSEGSNLVIRTLKLIAINSAVLAGILLGVEGCVRVMHPEIRPATIDRHLVRDNVYGSSRGLNPWANGAAMGAEFSITGEGFISYSAAPDSSLPVWLFLGDSVTMGIGVEPDSTFAGRIALAIADSMRLINPAAIGYTSRDYVNVLDSLLRRDDLHIERVTVMWCLNDVYSDSVAAEGPTGLRRLMPNVSGFVYRHVRSYQWLKAMLTDRPRAYYQHDQAFYRTPNRSLRAAAANLSRLKDISDSLRVTLDVVVIPYEYQLRTRDRIPQEELKALLEAEGIRLEDASQALGDAPADEYFLYGDGIPLSSLGHAAVSRFVLDLGRLVRADPNGTPPRAPSPSLTTSD